MEEIIIDDREPLATEYVPQVGDVVEFEYQARKFKGIVFSWYENQLVVSSNCRTGLIENLDSVTKIGETDVLKHLGVCDHSVTRTIREQYFAAPQFTGTYAKRQAQWVKHHDIKVGDKVRVVRQAYPVESGTHQCGSVAKKDVGLVFNVGQIRHHCISRVGLAAFPYFVLEPVK